MDSKSTVSKTQTEKDMEEFLRKNADVVYKKTSAEIGSRIHENKNNERIVIDGGYTKVIFFIFIFKHLFHAGMYKFNGLNTVVDKERVVNGSKDWMQKLV